MWFKLIINGCFFNSFQLISTYCNSSMISLTFTCGLTKYSRGLARNLSEFSSCRRTSSRRAEPNADTSSRLIAPRWTGSCCTSGNDFLRCNGTNDIGTLYNKKIK